MKAPRQLTWCKGQRVSPRELQPCSDWKVLVPVGIKGLLLLACAVSDPCLNSVPRKTCP